MARGPDGGSTLHEGSSRLVVFHFFLQEDIQIVIYTQQYVYGEIWTKACMKKEVDT